MPIGFLQGDKKLIRTLRALDGRRANTEINRALKAGAKVVEPAAKARVPKDRGVALRSIKVGKLKRSKKAKGPAWHVFADSKTIAREIARRAKRRRIIRLAKAGKRTSNYYPAYLEHGTPTMTKRPWLGPAFQATKSAAATEIKRTLKAGLKRIKASIR